MRDAEGLRREAEELRRELRRTERNRQDSEAAAAEERARCAAGTPMPTILDLGLRLQCRTAQLRVIRA